MKTLAPKSLFSLAKLSQILKVAKSETLSLSPPFPNNFTPISYTFSDKNTTPFLHPQ